MASSMTDPAHKRRNESGFYQDITQQIVDMDKAFLGYCDYEIDFERHIEGYQKNYVYRDSFNAEFRTNVIGEIAPASCGTVLSAKGNHYAGKTGEFRPITDDSKCKDVLALAVPANAIPKLNILFLNQIGTLNEIRMTDQTEECLNNQNPIVREWIRAPGTNPSGRKEIMLLHMPPKYGNPGGNGKSTRDDRVKKRPLNATEDDNQEKEVKREPEIKLGSFYDPTLSADFGGPLFQLSKNKLVQPDVCDEKNKLIPPWTFAETLRCGTLVLANISLHCFNMGDIGQQRKVYQLNVHSLRRLDESYLPFIEPERPILPAPSSPTTKIGANQKKAINASAAFSNFVARRTDEKELNGNDTVPIAASSPNEVAILKSACDQPQQTRDVPIPFSSCSNENNAIASSSKAAEKNKNPAVTITLRPKETRNTAGFAVEKLHVDKKAKGKKKEVIPADEDITMTEENELTMN